MDKKNINSYLKHYGFFIPSAEIYQGLANSWDLGPYGTEIKRNLKSLWWKYFITSSPYNVGCDSMIITHPRVLEASGHQKNFHDWLVDCLNCQNRYRLDNFLTADEFSAFLAEKNRENFVIEKNCPDCSQSKFTKPRKLNLLLTTNLEITDNKENLVYLRPETCQGIFINFLTIQRSSHRQLPFGIGQIGKSFRNEITLHHGIFRTREFEQLELEFFCSKEESEKWWNYWTEKSWNFLDKVIVNDKKTIKKVDLKKEELPHYAQKTLDLYFNYHFGWGELCSNSHRGNYDLSQHSKFSQQFLGIKEKGQEIIPEVIEVSFGVERLMLAILEDAYHEEVVPNSQLTRVFLKINPLLTPYFVAIIPLSKKLRDYAYQLYLELLKSAPFNLTWEETDSIGKSYRRQDAIGTYYCLTVDFQTAQDQKVTCRHRDTMEQDRIDIDSLKNIYIINMKNTDKTSRTSKWFYSAVFLLLAVSGGTLIYSFSGGQVSSFQQRLNHINDVNDLALPDKWKKYSNKELIGLAENNIKEKNKLHNKLLLREDFNLDTNQRKSLQDILKNIEELKLIEEEFEKLDNSKRNQLKEKIYKNWEKLSRIDFTIDPGKSDRLTKQFQSGQNYWLNNTFSQEKSEVESRLKAIINPFYHSFLNQILSENEEKPAKRVIPEKVAGQETTDDNYHQHVNYIINNNRYREFSSDVGYMETFKEMEIKWEGFTKFLAEGDDGEGEVTLGVTRCHHTEKVPGFPFEEPNSTKTNFFCANSPRLIEIELKKELVFGRLGEDHDQWVSKFFKDGEHTEWTLWDVSWDTLTETIAHELAHAVIDTLRSVYKGSDGKGHGLLHSRYTDKIREMMENSSEYKNFEVWWKEKW